MKNLELLYKKLRDLERGVSPWDLESLKTLDTLFQELTTSEDFEVRKISELKKHLKPEMSVQQFGHLLVPLERFLNKNVEDSDFLVLKKDSQQQKAKPIPLILVLHNLRSAFNVGSFIRTSECLQVQEVIFCGYTSTPDNSKTLKTAMGTDQEIKWSHQENLEQCLLDLKKNGTFTVAFETLEGSKSWDQPYPPKTCALVFGNERFGLEERHLKLCDEVRHLPVRGIKNSLNVSVAGAAAMYEWYRQWK